MARISIVGTGYVGLTTGASFAQLGHVVCCIDIDHDKIARLQAGNVPIFEPGVEELVSANIEAGRLRFSTDYIDGLQGTEFVFVAVGTPTAEDGHSADLRFVHTAVEAVARSLGCPAIVVNKSTSPVGTANGILGILTSTRPDLGPWTVVSNPEFLREGSAIFDCLHPSRVVLGATDRKAAHVVAQLYQPLDCPVIITDLNTAEMIKYASNAFLATRISFINEVAQICEALHADVSIVAEGMGHDPRIGSAFLNAGLGYGGSCFPKDVAALTHMAASAGLHPQLLQSVMDINADQRRWAVDRLAEEIGNLHGATVAIWGLAFKPNTDDIREAPALDIIRQLVQAGAAVRAYDPVAGCAVHELGPEVTICASPYEAVRNADAVLLATEWHIFTELYWPRVADLMRGDFVLDGRNCLDAELVISAGLRYVGVGRSIAPSQLVFEILSA